MIVCSWKGRLVFGLVCVRSQAANSLTCISRTCWAVTSGAGGTTSGTGEPGPPTGSPRDMVAVRSGLFRAGLRAGGVLGLAGETERGMAHSL
jgi:hypothetical protein